MPRRPRVFVPGLSVHVIQRGNNRMTVFGDDRDNAVYLVMVRDAARHHDVPIHAYALMKTHSHLLATPRCKESLSEMMKTLGVRYVRYFNRRNARCGTLWNERFTSILVEDERQWLTCLRYIEFNPVKAGIVAAPDEYRWTSYGVHAAGGPSEWLASHPVYESLGATPEVRGYVYRKICGVPLTEFEIAENRHRFVVPQPAVALALGGASPG